MGASLLDAIIQHRLCNNSSKDAQKKRRDEGKKIQERLKESRKIMLDVLNSIVIDNLDHPELIKFLKTRK